MLCDYSDRQVLDMIANQIKHMWFLEADDIAELENNYPHTMVRLETCIAAICNKYYTIRQTEGGHEHIFNPLHTGQYTMLLYMLANSIYKSGGKRSLCDRIYSISKIISGAELYYEVELPSIFFFDHPLGAVMGRAVYSDYFSFSQGCTVGNNYGLYPRFGRNVTMMSNSKVIGNCQIGNNVIIAANTYIKDDNIPSDGIVFGASPNLVIKTGRHGDVMEVSHQMFNLD